MPSYSAETFPSAAGFAGASAAGAGSAADSGLQIEIASPEGYGVDDCADAVPEGGFETLRECERELNGSVDDCGIKRLRGVRIVKGRKILNEWCLGWQLMGLSDGMEGETRKLQRVVDACEWCFAG